MASPMPRFPPVTRTDRLIGVPSSMIIELTSAPRRAYPDAATRGGIGCHWGSTVHIPGHPAVPDQARDHVSEQGTGPGMQPSTGAGTQTGGNPGAGLPLHRDSASLPLRDLAAAALQRAGELGAEPADFRAERIRGQEIGLSDGHLETLMAAARRAGP